jgi:hypothetical protein
MGCKYASECGAFAECPECECCEDSHPCECDEDDGPAWDEDGWPCDEE